MRTSGIYTTYRGHPRAVAYRDADGYVLYAADGSRSLAETVPNAELGDIVEVTVTATWRGGRVGLTRVEGERVVFVTHDRALAEREGLPGSQHDGWGGVAPATEFDDVEERVRVIEKRGAT